MRYDPDEYEYLFTDPEISKEEIEIIDQLQALDYIIKNDPDYKETIHNLDYFGIRSKSNNNNTYNRSVKSFFIKAVGVTYGNRQQIIATLKTGDGLKIVHEKDNKYDSNALLILTNNGEQIGYVSKESNKDLLKKLNENLIKSITVANITGEGYSNKGVNIKIEVFNKILENNTLDNDATIKNHSYDTQAPTYSNSNSTSEEFPLGCLGIILLIIIILIIGLSGGINNW